MGALKDKFKKLLRPLVMAGLWMSLILGSGAPACFVAVGFECFNDFDCPINEFCNFDGVCVFVGFFDKNIRCEGADMCPTVEPPPVQGLRESE